MTEQKIYLPDGRGLPDEVRADYAHHNAPIHLRLTATDGSTARGGCEHGLGQLWTGRPDEVTCPDCLEVGARMTDHDDETRRAEEALDALERGDATVKRATSPLTDAEREVLASLADWFHGQIAGPCIHPTNGRPTCEAWADAFVATGPCAARSVRDDPTLEFCNFCNRRDHLIEVFQTGGAMACPDHTGRT